MSKFTGELPTLRDRPPPSATSDSLVASFHLSLTKLAKRKDYLKLYGYSKFCGNNVVKTFKKIITASRHSCVECNFARLKCFGSQQYHLCDYNLQRNFLRVALS
jgi:hypothetical protein